MVEAGLIKGASVEMMHLGPILGQAAPAAGGSMFSTLMMMFLIFGIFYFMLIRPQQKEQQEHQKLLASLQKGDKVVTSSGVHGEVHEVLDEVVALKIADKVRINIDKSAIKRKS